MSRIAVAKDVLNGRDDNLAGGNGVGGRVDSGGAVDLGVTVRGLGLPRLVVRVGLRDDAVYGAGQFKPDSGGAVLG